MNLRVIFQSNQISLFLAMGLKCARNDSKDRKVNNLGIPERNLNNYFIIEPFSAMSYYFFSFRLVANCYFC